MRLHGISHDVFDRYRSTVPSWRYEVVAPGYKYNLTDPAAAMGRVQLRRSREMRDKRAAIAARYDEAFSELPVQLPAHAIEGDTHAWHLYVIHATAELGVGRDELAAELAAEGVDTSVHFIPVHQLSYFRKVLGDHAGVLPGTDSAAAQVLSLPIYPAMTDAQVDRVCNALAAIAGAAVSGRTVARGVSRA
jgi:dTDP-4-amino-4,6-dideoxygalactose transaminase